jgi:hypothetical protein
MRRFRRSARQAPRVKYNQIVGSGRRANLHTSGAPRGEVDSVARDAIALSVSSAERRSHWENVYATKVEDEASRFQKTDLPRKAGSLCGHQKKS